MRAFCHCVFLVRDFALLVSHFFCKKLRFSQILQDFLLGIGIWFWAVENLGSIHHVFVVLDPNCRPLQERQTVFFKKAFAFCKSDHFEFVFVTYVNSQKLPKKSIILMGFFSLS